MIEDIYEPLARYREEFKDKFAWIAKATFERLKNDSGVDVEANKQTVAEIKKRKAELDGIRGRAALWKFAAFILWAAVAVCGCLCFLMFYEHSDADYVRKGIVFGAAALASLLLAVFQVHPKIAMLNKKAEELEEIISGLMEQAWEQMAPLNRLFTWDLLTGMMKKCVPRLEFDPYFNEARLQDLRESFDWSDSFNDGMSILFAHSGVINDNPFVICRYLNSDWGVQSYTGSLTITYTETVRGSDGKWRSERRYQTLYATIERPVPVYDESTMVIYANDAAPKSSFSRTPSKYSGEDGFFSNVGKKMALKELEKFARNLEDDSNFTMMSNREFEVLFHAKDRNDEVEFRLLFTALAQQQMVNLLNDKEVGFGDDFSFAKSKKINFVAPEHLNDFDLDTDPAQFKNYDFENMQEFFLRRSQDYFRRIYFALAPLLTIPLYQQTRTVKSIYGCDGEVHPASFWETESFVNYLGEDRFKHPKSITRNILKTSTCPSPDGVVSVTADGYRGEDRVEYVSVWGNDGRCHNVPVEWIEYLPVSRTSKIKVDIADEYAAAADPQGIRRRLRQVS